MPCSASASRGEIQTEVDRLPPVVGERLVGRREGQEEMGVEALRHEGGRDPVGEGNEPVDCRDERLAGHELGEGRAAVERATRAGRDELVPAARARDQHAAFLERLADRGDLATARAGPAPQPSDAASSASAGSIRPPGKTSAPEAKSIW